MDLTKFQIFLRSVTIANIKEVIKTYNDNYGADKNGNGPLKGYSGLKKNDLIDFVQVSIPEEIQTVILDMMEPDFSEKIMSEAISLIAGEHRTAKILNTGACTGGKGYTLWINGKYGKNKATVKAINGPDKIERNCNCKIGRIDGVCFHQMAIYLMIQSKNLISLEEMPFKVDKHQYQLANERMQLLASQKLFNEEPAIVLEEDYNIYINGNLVTLEWGGKFPGKTTKDISKEGNDDMDSWISRKVIDIMLRKIKVKSGAGKPVRILIDSYDVISKILVKEKLVKKILKKFAVLNDPNLPDNETLLNKYLKSGLKENMEELAMAPPFEAYMGNDPYIFVSYTHKDKSEVYPILKRLHETGFKVWYDEGIPLTTEWINTIASQLEGCKLFLSFISPYVMESDNTQDEIHMALNEKKTFLAVYLRETELSPGLKMRIRRIQGILKHEMKEKQFHEKLAAEIGTLLK